MSTNTLIVAAVLSLSLFGSVSSMAQVHSPTNEPVWSDGAVLRDARAALGQAQRAHSMEHEFYLTRDAWASYRAAEDALNAGDTAKAKTLAETARFLAEQAAKASSGGNARQARRNTTWNLMTDAIASTNVVPMVTADGVELTFDALFEPESASLSERGVTVVDKMADLALTYPAYRLTIEGYVPVGHGATASLTLMQSRGVALTNALEARGIGAGRVTSRLNDEPLSSSVQGADFVFAEPDRGL